METIKQVSVSLENKPGRLAKVLSALAREKVNIRALSVMHSHEHSVLRLVTDDLGKTHDVLQQLGTPHNDSEVLAIELRNQPGELAHICELLAAEHINIDYCYCSAGGRNGKTLGVFKLSNNDKAQRALLNGVNHTARKRVERRPNRDRRAYESPDRGSR
jgi:hypothetical protein